MEREREREGEIENTAEGGERVGAGGVDDERGG